MLELYSDKEKEFIINNTIQSCKDINKLRQATYRYLNLSSGFIAHYSRYGFIDFYSEKDSLKNDILKFQNENQWSNFRIGGKDYEYYHQKAEMYNEICKRLMEVI